LDTGVIAGALATSGILLGAVIRASFAITNSATFGFVTSGAPGLASAAGSNAVGPGFGTWAACEGNEGALRSRTGAMDTVTAVEVLNTPMSGFRRGAVGLLMVAVSKGDTGAILSSPKLPEKMEVTSFW
jgi:hypothetical protein